MFEFLSNNTSVEYTLTNTSKSNYITTSHENGIEKGFDRVYNKGFIKGSIEKTTHNHPSNLETPSTADKAFKKELLKVTKSSNILFQIYTKEEKKGFHYHKY